MITQKPLRYTQTCDGPIPHFWHPILHTHLPVKLARREKGGGFVTMMRKNDGPVPERMSDGRLIYALPGGGEYVEPLPGERQ